MGGSAVKFRVVYTSYHKHRLVLLQPVTYTARLTVLYNSTVSAVSAFRRNVSAETEFVLLHFGRSRNQAKTVC